MLTQVRSAADGSPQNSIAVPAVMNAPVRSDLVSFVHKNMAKNRRQPYAVKHRAGMGYSAHSWGPGRARARVPRIHASGSRISGSGAFANMCRGGRMFAPTQTWRKWHRKTNLNVRRYAVCSAIAASRSVPLVSARGHAIDSVKEIPLVIDDSIESVKKTSQALKILDAVGANTDVARVIASRKVRSTKGKGRNRRYVQRVGPLVVFATDNGIRNAFTNIPGVDVCSVERLNLLDLAPGGHLGRFVIWSASAFAKLNEIFGTEDEESKQKKGFTVPRSIVTNADLSRVINSNELSSVVRPAKTNESSSRRKVNPLTNAQAMATVNPYDSARRRTVARIKSKAQREKVAKMASNK